MNIRKIANIAMWAIAGSFTLFCVVFGVGVALSMISHHPGDYIIAIIMGFGIILFGAFLSFVFVSICKLIGTVLFYSGLVKDYKRRKKRGEYREKY